MSDFNEALRLNENFIWIYIWRAEIYRAQGKNDLADADTAAANRLRAAGY